MLSLEDDELLNDIDNYEDSRLELRMKSHNLVYCKLILCQQNITFSLCLDISSYESKRNKTPASNG